MSKQTIPTASLREFLALFAATAVVENLELGDTWHPSAGFVDEEILAGCRTVGDILAFPYDFRGLIEFNCRIDGVEVKFQDETFEIGGDDWKIYRLLDRFTFPNNRE
jgi:hypothetical protein